MNKEIKQRWIAALRSGDYRQGSGRLCVVGSLDDPDDMTPRYCCLGVLSDLAVEAGIVTKHVRSTDNVAVYESQVSSDRNYLSPSILRWAELDDEHGDPRIGWKNASQWNDTYHLTFDEIADKIEEFL